MKDSKITSKITREEDIEGKLFNTINNRTFKDFPNKEEICTFFDKVLKKERIEKELSKKIEYWFTFLKSGCWNWFVNENNKETYEKFLLPRLWSLNNWWKAWIISNEDTELAKIMKYKGNLIRIQEDFFESDFKIPWVSWSYDIY